MFLCVLLVEKRIIDEHELCVQHDETLVRLACEEEVICPMCQKLVAQAINFARM